MRILLLLMLFFAGHTLFAQRQTPIDSLKTSIEKLQKTIDSQKAEIQQIETKATNGAVVQISGWWHSAIGILVTVLIGLVTIVTIVFVIRGFNTDRQVRDALQRLSQQEDRIDVISDSISKRADKTFDYFTTTSGELDIDIKRIKTDANSELESIKNEAKTTVEGIKILIGKEESSHKIFLKSIDEKNNKLLSNVVIESFEITKNLINVILETSTNKSEYTLLLDKTINNFADVLKDLGKYEKARELLKSISNFENDPYSQSTLAEIEILQSKQVSIEEGKKAYQDRFITHIKKAIDLGYPIEDKFLHEEKEAYIEAIKLPEFIKLLRDKGLISIITKLQELAKRYI